MVVVMISTTFKDDNDSSYDNDNIDNHCNSMMLRILRIMIMLF